MIKIKPGKDWRKANALLRNYGARLEFVRKQILIDFAELFLKKIKDFSPTGEDFEEYVKSLKVVQITGLSGGMAYAVVSERHAISLGKIIESEKPHIIYIELSTSPDSADPLSVLATQHNPWAPELIPHGIDRSEVELIHRVVNQPELDFVRGKTKKFLLLNRPTFTKLGASWKSKDSDTENPREKMRSLPDYMWQGLRAEFGIKAPSHPHWRPALRATVNQLERIIEGNDDVQCALYDHLFRKHLQTQQLKKDNMSASSFNKEAGDFQARIANVIGAF